MITNARPPFVVVVIGVLMLATAACGASSMPVTRPACDAFFVAPSADYADQHDPLIAESALRLAAMELALRHELVTGFVPLDQQDPSAPATQPTGDTARAS